MRPTAATTTARSVGLAGLATLWVLSACTLGNYPLPDPGTEHARENTAHITRVLESNDAITGANAKCKVRYLGEKQGALFAWAECTGFYEGSSVPTSISNAFRIDGTSTQWPQAGAYVEDVRRLFPSRLARDILKNPERLRPEHGR